MDLAKKWLTEAIELLIYYFALASDDGTRFN
jgi:hypothetical protein